MSTLDWTAAAVRWILFTGIVAAVGVSAYWLTQIRPLRRLSDRFEGYCDAADRMARGFAFRVALFLVLPGVVLRLATQFAQFRDPYEEAILPQVDLLVNVTVWGFMWRLQLGVALALLLFAFILKRNGTPLRWTLYTLAAVVLAFTPALSGHAWGSEEYRALAVATDGLHVLGAGGWIGALGLMVLGLSRLQDECDEAGAAPLQVAFFSPSALAWVGTLVVTGIISSWLHVTALDQLWTTAYGQRLLIKVGFVVVTIALGAYNWRRIKPGLVAETHGRTDLVRSGGVELLLGWVVLLVTAILVATALPGEG